MKKGPYILDITLIVSALLAWRQWLCIGLLFASLSTLAQITAIPPNVPSPDPPKWNAKPSQSLTMQDSNLSGRAEPPQLSALEDAVSNATNLLSNNSVQRCDEFPGASLDVQLNACISAAAATKVGAEGIADATRLRSGIIAAQVDVGNHEGTNNVVLLMPKTASWAVTITDGKSCGIMLHTKSAMISLGNNSNGTQMNIVAANKSTKVVAIVCTDPDPPEGGAYVMAEGFGVVNDVGATLASAAFTVNFVFDNSIFRNIAVGATSGTAMTVTGACCGTAFYDLLVDCHSRKGCVPLTLGGMITSHGIESVGFFNASIGHPGMGLHNISISSNASNENINWYNLYMEPNAVDTSTALFEIGAKAHDVNIYGAVASNAASGSTAYMVDVASWPGPANDTFSGLKSQTYNLVNDHVTGLTIKGDPNYGASALYVSGTSILTSAKAVVLDQTTANHFAGVSTCSGGTKMITLPITYHSQPVVMIFDETTVGGVKLGSKSGSGFTVSCVGSTDTFDWMVIGNPD